MTTAIAEPKKPSAAAPPVPADAGSPSVNIAVSRIVPSPWNRKAEVTDDLVESVRKNGVVQNVVLRPHKATEEDVALYCMKSDPFAVGDPIFQLVAGERRWGAAKKAGRSHIPAAIRQLSDIEAMDFQIDENENRKNLRPMERAEAYDRLRMLYQEAHAKDKDYTEAKAIEAVAISRNCSSRTVYDVISLKKLTQNAQHALRNGELETSHGVALAGRSQEDQEKLLLWIRQQTHHSQGDVPSVRRLKLEIRQLDIAAEDQKRQEKLFKESQSGTSATPVPTVSEQLYQKAVHLVREGKLHAMHNQFLQRGLNLALTPDGEALAGALFARMEKEGIVTPEKNGLRGFIFPKSPAPAEQKPPTKAQLKAAEKQREKEAKAAEQRREKEAKEQRDHQRNERIEKRYQEAFFTTLATKAQINSRFLTHIVPDLLFEVWDNKMPIDGIGKNVLGWPAPKNGIEYVPDEIRKHCLEHPRKYTPKLLAALLITLHTDLGEAQKLAKYFGVDPKKLRKKAAATVKEEERVARTPKVPATQEEKLFYHHAIQGDEATWNKMRREGATNGEIREHLSSIFGEYGGYGSKDDGSIHYWGGKDPRVVFDTKTSKPWPRKGQPLKGAALVAAVRDLLKIPEKGDVDA